MCAGSVCDGLCIVFLCIVLWSVLCVGMCMSGDVYGRIDFWCQCDEMMMYIKQ